MALPVTQSATSTLKEHSSPSRSGAVPPAVLEVLAEIVFWWSQKASMFSVGPEWSDVFSAIDAPIPFDISALPTPTGQFGSFDPEEIGTAYLGVISELDRTKNGKFYTPSFLSEYSWNRIRTQFSSWNRTGYPTILDPACGTGNLLRQPIRDMVERGTTRPAETLAEIKSKVCGFELDPIAAWIANVILNAELLPLLAALPANDRTRFTRLVTADDALTAAITPADIVLMNPPYSKAPLPEEQRAKFKHVLHGHANLYALFLFSAEKWLRSNGWLLTITPTTYTTGKSFEKLRKHLVASMRLEEIAFIRERSRVFPSVLQEICISIFRKGAFSGSTLVRTISNGAVESELDVDMPDSQLPWMLPKRLSRYTVTKIPSDSVTLAELGFKVSTGPFVWNRNREFLAPRSSKNSLPVVWSSDLSSGKLFFSASRQHLRHFIPTDSHDLKYLRKTKPCILIQRTNAPEQSRRIVSAALSAEDIENIGGAFTVENHVNIVEPISPLASTLMPTLLQVLASPVLEEISRAMTGSVALSKYEILSIPFPPQGIFSSLTDKDQSTLDNALERYYRGIVDVASRS